jgi:hypothetical protein
VHKRISTVKRVGTISDGISHNILVMGYRTIYYVTGMISLIAMV